MKIVLAMLLPVALSGCMLELLTTTAIQGELAAKDAQAGVQALNYTKEFASKTEAQSAVQAYQADTGKLPPSLAALVPGYLPKVPVHPDGSPYGYDPATGKIFDSPAMAPAPRVPFTEEDGRNIKKLEDAIYAFWQSTSNYPKSLGELQPLFIDKVPTLSSGGQFVYDPQTGAVYHPNDLQPAPGAAQGARGAIGIQNQLRDMNNSGTQAVQGTARRGLGGIQDSYNQAQQRALEQIDQ